MKLKALLKRKNAGTARGWRLIAGYLGAFLMLIGAIVLIPMFMMIFFPRESAAWASFLITGLSAIIIGFLVYYFCLAGAEKGKLEKHQDALLLVLLWLMALIVGAFPFFLHGYLSPGAYRYSFIECLFESTSGFTTTGLSVYRHFLDCYMDSAGEWHEIGVGADAELIKASLAANCPHIFIFYRSVLHFFGGVGLVLIAASAISDAHGMKLYTAEGHNDKLLPNLKKSSRLILTIYAGYILAGTIALWLFGMDWFDALQHSVAALATGGLSSRSTSFYYFLNPETISTYEAAYDGISSGCIFSNLSGFNGITPVNTMGMEIVGIVLMFLGATNFVIHTELFTAKFKQFFRDIEIRFVALLLAVGIPLMLIGTLSQWSGDGTISFGTALRYAIFQFVSCLTTTGFSNVKTIVYLGPSVLFLSVVTMSIGGGMGSTGGGLKQFRTAICLKEVWLEIKYHSSPKRMLIPKPFYRFGVKRQLSDAEFKDASQYTTVYVAMILIGTVFLALLPTVTFDQAIYEVSSAISGTGNSMIDFLKYFGEASVANRIWSYNLLLIILVIYMYLGRLEILPVFYAASYVFQPSRGATRTGGEIN